MRFAVIFLPLSILIFACTPARKVQKSQQVISTADTMVAVVKTENKQDSNKAVTAISNKDIFSKVVRSHINFTTFSAKAHLQYEAKEGNDDATAYVRLRKDSIMWLSLRGPLGIEGYRVLITKDSVKIMNVLKKNVQYRSIAFLRDVTGIPFDFITLQDLVIGNPVFIDSNIVSYNMNSNNQLVVLMSGRFFKNLVTLDSEDKILSSKLDDINVGTNRTCNITYGDYENTTGVSFSTTRNISIEEESKLSINLNFKQYSFNQSITFPFNVPKNYKRL